MLEYVHGPTGTVVTWPKVERIHPITRLSYMWPSHYIYVVQRDGSMHCALPAQRTPYTQESFLKIIEGERFKPLLQGPEGNDPRCPTCAGTGLRERP